jgi:hypothetical protein
VTIGHVLVSPRRLGSFTRSARGAGASLVTITSITSDREGKLKDTVTCVLEQEVGEVGFGGYKSSHQINRLLGLHAFQVQSAAKRRMAYHGEENYNGDMPA